MRFKRDELADLNAGRDDEPPNLESEPVEDEVWTLVGGEAGCTEKT